MSVPLYHVDAFTAVPFKGNPAAVCLLDAPRDITWMQNVAREMNLSETAFIVPQSDGSFGIRWCTPTVEVDLCGHATLASAHTLWETHHVAPDASIAFQSRSGPLGARRNGTWIELDFPARREERSDPPPGLLSALGVQPRYIGRNIEDYIVLVDSEEEVRQMKPDHAGLRPLGVRGVIVTARSTQSGFDFVSRFFAPGAGIDEDPVTGSAHCCLGPFWQERLHKSEFTAYQASARGGVVKVKVEGERVVIAGEAVTVAKGELI